MFSHLRHKLLLVVGAVVALGLVATAAFYTRHQEESILAENKRTMHKVTEGVVKGLESLMLSSHPDIMRPYADRLKKIADAADFRILRVDGAEAFRDNQTLRDVNARLGEQAFELRAAEQPQQVVSPREASFMRSVRSGEASFREELDVRGQRTLTLFDPIPNQAGCHRCHEAGPAVRGVVKLTLSLAGVERDILRARTQSLLVLGAALLGTLALTGYMIGRSVLRPIERVTDAMVRASSGDLQQQVPVQGDDELSQMAGSFNHMTDELQKTYAGLRHEQDKLTTVILGAREAIVVTDADGTVVLVNPSAEELLGKPADRIVREGFHCLLDDPATMEQWLARPEGTSEVLEYNGRVFNIHVSTIRAASGHPVGSAALLRDVTQEKRMEDELRRLSTTDALTGLYNRRHLDLSLDAELARSRRYPQPLAVIMMDVDHFKRFNDQHGHEVGDRVLQAVAAALRAAVRGQDLPCRYGGEEFLAILPNTDRAGAAILAERIRRDVEELLLEGGLHVTVSLGVACLADIPGTADSEALVAAADKALYEAKAAGRNRVQLARAAAAYLT